MIRHVAYIMLVMFICLTSCLAQKHPLPLKIKSIHTNYVEEVFAQYQFQTNHNRGQTPNQPGYKFEIIMDFELEDTTFIKNPSFKIFLSDLNNDVQSIDIDSNMVVNYSKNYIRVSFEVKVDRSCWVNIYCFPSSFDSNKMSIWDLKNGSDIQRAVYLKVLSNE